MALNNLLSLSFLVPFVAAKNDFSRAVRGLRGMPRRLLLIGHKLATGAQALDTIVTVSTEPAAIAAFGEGSQMLAMWRAAKANAGLGLPIDTICIAPNGTAVVATQLVTIGNSSGASAPYSTGGEAMLYIGGVRVSVGVSSTDTRTTVAAKLLAAINARPSLPVTASATANTNEILLTCRWGGPTGNDIDVRGAYYADDTLPAGMNIGVALGTAGAGEPDVTPVIAAMAGYRATELVCAFTGNANLVLLEAELDLRWQANNMQDGALAICVRGSESQITTALGSRNSPHVHLVAVSKDVTSPWETAAMVGAAVESQAMIDPALPHTGIALVGYQGAVQGKRLTLDQINNVLLAGGCPLLTAPDNSGTLLRMVTTYTQTAQGAADRSMAELAWMKTMSYYRWFHVTEFMTKYQGFKLAQYLAQPIPGQKIMTKDLAEEVMIGIYKLFMEAGLCQNEGYYRDTLVVEIDGPNGKLKIQDEPVIVTQHYQTEITSFVVAGQT